MSSEVKAQKCFATCTIGGVSYSPEYVEYVSQINQWPSIVVRVLMSENAKKEDTQAIKIDATTAHTFGQRKKRWTSEGTKVNLTFGIGDVSTSINGLVNNVELFSSPYDAYIGIGVLPDYVAELDKLNLSHWNFIYNDIDGQPSRPLISSSELVFTYILRVVHYLKQLWESGGKQKYLADKPASEAAKVALIDKINNKSLHYFEEILRNSNSLKQNNTELLKVGQFLNIKGMNEQMQRQLYDTVVTALTTSNGSFLSNICQLGNAFRLIYIPKPNNVGYYVARSSLADETNTQELETEITTLNIQAGGYGIAQPGYVYIESDATYRDGDDPAQIQHAQYQRNMAIYPDNPDEIPDLSSGRKITAPTWVPAEPIIDYITNKNNLKPPTCNNTKLAADRNVGVVKDYNEKIKALLDAWCKEEYLYVKTENSSANIQTFYNVAPDQFGDRAKISSKSGYLFSGSIVMYRAYVALQGSKLSGGNQIQFSNVILAGE